MQRRGVVRTCLGIQSWDQTTESVNWPAWYISVLLLCYGLFFWATDFARRRGISPYLCYAVFLPLGIAAVYVKPELPFLQVSTGRGYYPFFLGLFLGRALDPGKGKGFLHRASFFRTLLAGVVLTGTAVWLLHVGKGPDALILVFAAFPAVVVLCESKMAKRIFRSKLWGYAGKVSFDAYLWHVPVIGLILALNARLDWELDFSRIPVMLAALVITWGLSALTYFALEKRLNRAAEKWLLWMFAK